MQPHRPWLSRPARNLSASPRRRSTASRLPQRNRLHCPRLPVSAVMPAAVCSWEGCMRAVRACPGTLTGPGSITAGPVMADFSPPVMTAAC